MQQHQQLAQQHLALRQQEVSVVPVALVQQLQHQQHRAISDQVRQYKEQDQCHNKIKPNY